MAVDQGRLSNPTAGATVRDDFGESLLCSLEECLGVGSNLPCCCEKLVNHHVELRHSLWEAFLKRGDELLFGDSAVLIQVQSGKESFVLRSTPPCSVP